MEVDLRNGVVVGAEVERLVRIEDITASSSLTIAGDDGVDEVTVTRGDRGYVVSGDRATPCCSAVATRSMPATTAIRTR